MCPLRRGPALAGSGPPSSHSPVWLPHLATACPVLTFTPTHSRLVWGKSVLLEGRRPSLQKAPVPCFTPLPRPAQGHAPSCLQAWMNTACGRWRVQAKLPWKRQLVFSQPPRHEVPGPASGLVPGSPRPAGCTRASVLCKPCLSWPPARWDKGTFLSPLSADWRSAGCHSLDGTRNPS